MDVFAVENVQVVRSFIVKKVPCARTSGVATETPVLVSRIRGAETTAEYLDVNFQGC